MIGAFNIFWSEIVLDAKIECTIIAISAFLAVVFYLIKHSFKKGMISFLSGIIGFNALILIIFIIVYMGM